MTENEIKQGLLQVCKVAGWDGDFNVVGFHALCDKLKELGAAAEREACAKMVEDSWMAFSRAPNVRLDITPFPELSYVAKAIRARGRS